MKIFEFIRRLFRNKKSEVNLYSKAVAEGFKDAFEELGCSMGLDTRE